MSPDFSSLLSTFDLEAKIGKCSIWNRKLRTKSQTRETVVYLRYGRESLWQTSYFSTSRTADWDDPAKVDHRLEGGAVIGLPSISSTFQKPVQTIFTICLWIFQIKRSAGDKKKLFKSDYQLSNSSFSVINFARQYASSMPEDVAWRRSKFGDLILSLTHTYIPAN